MMGVEEGRQQGLAGSRERCDAQADRHQPDDRSDDFLEWRRGLERHHLGRHHVPYQVVRWVLPRVDPRFHEDRLRCLRRGADGHLGCAPQGPGVLSL
jgi:hypothetical protein